MTMTMVVTMMMLTMVVEVVRVVKKKMMMKTKTTTTTKTTMVWIMMLMMKTNAKLVVYGWTGLNKPTVELPSLQNIQFSSESQTFASSTERDNHMEFHTFVVPSNSSGTSRVNRESLLIWGKNLAFFSIVASLKRLFLKAEGWMHLRRDGKQIKWLHLNIHRTTTFL